jgi:outer membrane protein insertion porin family
MEKSSHPLASSPRYRLCRIAIAMAAFAIIALRGAPAIAAPPPPSAAEEAAEAIPEAAPTEAERARGLPITRVTLGGNRRVPAEELAGYLHRTRPGKPFSPEGLSKDVQELWASGLLDDVEADLRPNGGGVEVRLFVRERPSLEGVEIDGAHEIDKDDLIAALSPEIAAGAVLGHEAVARGRQKLRDKYAEAGYWLAEVSPEIVPRKGNKVLLRYHVVEHDKVNVRRITFLGNEHVPEDELREAMITGHPGFFEFGTGGTFRQDAFERDILVISGLYYDKGYLSVALATPRIEITPDRTGVILTIAITEGPCYSIRSLRVEERDPEGREVEPLGGKRHLVEMIHARPGDVFNRSALARDLAAIQTMYRDAGYASVEAAPATELDPEHHAVDLAIGIRRREPVRFGRIQIQGNTKTRDKVIRRELTIVEGGLFSETALEQSKRRVEALGYFGRVDISTEQGQAPGEIDVNVEIQEKPTGTFQLGAGFSSLESFMGTAQIQQSNLLGTGRSLSLQAQLSGMRQLVDVRYFDPHFLDSRVSFGADAYNQLRVYDRFSQESRGAALTLGYPLLDPHLRASITYTLQRDRLARTPGSSALGTAAPVSVFQDLPLANLWAAGVTSSVRAALTYDTRNNQLFASSGMFLQGSVEVAPSWLGSENRFLRWRGTARFYHPLTADGQVVLKLNTEAGLVTSPGRGGVPLFSRFFLGGLPDVRGFPLRSLGPRLPLRNGLDENADPIPGAANIGGNLMFYQNLELEFPILEALNVRGLVFADLGNTWNLESKYCRAARGRGFASTSPCFAPLDLLHMRASVGFGVRWTSPLGPLRFEWGFPIHPLPYEKPMLFEFTIGGSF